MAQLSRPFQIALAAVALLAAVWLFALRGHSPSAGGSEPGAAPAAPTSPVTSPTAKAAGSTAQAPKLPGQKGLETAIDKAHGAVATSSRNAAELERKSARASGESASTGAAAHKAVTTAPATPKRSAPSTHAAAPKTPAAATAPALQRAVEGELARGDVVVLLFWDRNGADDQAVHSEMRSLRSAGKVAVHEAPPSQVASFGTITRGVQVYGTPTVLVVGRKGQTQTLTGLQDAYAIRQAIAEARHAS